MAPTKSLPTALHQELSEYASLLRSIRTNSTLDLVPQLSRPQPAHDETDESAKSEDDDSESDSSRHSRQHPDNLAGSQDHKELPELKKKSKKASRSGGQKRIKKEHTWTRWPLLLDDCALPEWGLDEEVKTIADHALRSHASNQDPGPSRPAYQADAGGSSRGEVEDELAHPDLSPIHLSGLVADASSKLSSLLSLLAMHRTNVTYTKHGRVDPMGWEDVLEVVGAAELFDQEVVEDVKRRMEEVFGPSGTQVIDHMQVVAASKRVLAAAEATFGEDVLSLVGPPPTRQRKRKRGADESASGDDGVEDPATRQTSGPAEHSYL